MAGLNDLASRADIHPDSAKRLFDTITEMLLDGDDVRISGFGTFRGELQAEHIHRSPVVPDGETKVPTQIVFKFRMSKETRLGRRRRKAVANWSE